MNIILNPFTPSSIVNSREDFFGRENEIYLLDRTLQQGSIVIQGPIGIGKSSLVSRILVFMNSNESAYDSKIILCVSHSDILSVDDAARLILEELCDIDEESQELSIEFPKLASYKSSKAFSYFKSGRYLSTLLKIIEDKAFISDVNDSNYIIFAIDECDKSPAPIAKLIRQILTKTQILGIKNIRFLLSGIRPFYEEMLKEDEGISRFIIKPISISKLDSTNSRELLESKFKKVVSDSKLNKYKVNIDMDTIERVLILANGHPHLLQLLGSNLIESENEYPDEIIDSKDLLNSLNSICYENRAVIYNKQIEFLKKNELIDNFNEMISKFSGFPTKIKSSWINNKFDEFAIENLVVNNFLIETSEGFELVDEFLKIRLILDSDNKENSKDRIIPMTKIQNYYSDEDDYSEWNTFNNYY